MSGVSIPDLRAKLKGRVITPGDDAYESARRLFYGMYDNRPALIVRAADAKDVSYVVSLARETGSELSIRSGGHSTAGYSVSDGGIMLDLKDMRSLVIDTEKRTAWAETGLTAGEYTTQAAALGLATGFGDTGSVGIGGITLGGGIGFLVRKHGMTIDSLLAADVVTADGQLLRVDEQSHPDLFWAIRGGGGNFGVVTRFQYRLHELKTILGGMLILPATPDVLASFIAEAEAAPEELSTIVNVMPSPPMPFVPAEYHGKLIIMAMMVYAGSLEDGERAVAPFRTLAKPIADMLRPMIYPEMFPAEEGGGDYRPSAVGRTLFIDRIRHEDAKNILQFLESNDAPMRVAQIRVLGGAMARVPVEATAFAHRQARIMAGLYSFYMSPEDRAKKEAWVRDFTAALYQDNPGEYVNFMDKSNIDQIKNAYPGRTWERLTAIKARYDPNNLFRLNQNIPPVPPT
ncbi:MAG: FAD-binding oxidoreductase [Deltaproteobacteria bacterium]|nr:FAD-binding oxidoreductase [Candidatus Anaeroferrophillacea bacterium]